MGLERKQKFVILHHTLNHTAVAREPATARGVVRDCALCSGLLEGKKVFNLHAFTTPLLPARGHFNLFSAVHGQIEKIAVATVTKLFSEKLTQRWDSFEHRLTLANCYL